MRKRASNKTEGDGPGRDDKRINSGFVLWSPVRTHMSCDLCETHPRFTHNKAQGKKVQQSKAFLILVLLRNLTVARCFHVAFVSQSNELRKAELPDHLTSTGNRLMPQARPAVNMLASDPRSQPYTVSTNRSLETFCQI